MSSVIVIEINDIISNITYGYLEFTIDVTHIMLRKIKNNLTLIIENNLFKCDPSNQDSGINILTINFVNKQSIEIKENSKVKFISNNEYHSHDKIYVYFHVCQINNWIEIVTNIYQCILYSGLINVIDELCVGILGNEINQLINIMNHEKVRIVYISSDTTLYERPTLNKLYDRCQDENCKVLYLHSKGVRYTLDTPNNVIVPIKAWVKYLCYFNIERYQDCLDVLNSYDVCGTEWLLNHFRGNFWWANSYYIRCLPSSIGQEYTGPEAWINLYPNKLNKKVYNFHISGIYLYNIIINENDYRFDDYIPYKFEYGNSTNMLYVTPYIKSLFKINNNQITIKKLNYNLLFSDPDFGKIKYLKITIHDLKPIYLKENTSFTIDLLPKPIVKINIVYFINIYCQEKYIYILKSQLLQLIQTGIIINNKIYIQVSGPKEKHENIIEELDLILNGHNYEIECHEENNHEFFGINKIWELSQNNDIDNEDSIILYFHSKGISRISNPTEDDCRLPNEKAIFNIVINDYKRVIRIFEIFKSINKVSCGSDKLGWCWYNYFYVRASYARFCEKPIITSYRYYYEEWVSKYLGYIDHSLDHNFDQNQDQNQDQKPQDSYNQIPDDCYNLCYSIEEGFYNIGSSVDAYQMCYLQEKYFSNI
jgi:hypothetical protein